jgi:hypothetical protein
MLAVRRKKTFPREAREQGDRFATVNRNILRVELRSLLPQSVMPVFGLVPLMGSNISFCPAVTLSGFWPSLAAHWRMSGQREFAKSRFQAPDFRSGSFASILACPRHVRFGGNLGNAGCPDPPFIFRYGRTKRLTCLTNYDGKLPDGQISKNLSSPVGENILLNPSGKSSLQARPVPPG